MVEYRLLLAEGTKGPVGSWIGAGMPQLVIGLERFAESSWQCGQSWKEEGPRLEELQMQLSHFRRLIEAEHPNVSSPCTLSETPAQL